MRLAVATLVLGVAVAAAVWVSGYRTWHNSNCGWGGFATPGCTGNGYYTRPGWASAPVGIIIGFVGLAAALAIARQARS